jgi:hypothetical protein
VRQDIAAERFGRRPEWEQKLLCPNDPFEQHRDFNLQAAAEHEGETRDK